MNINSEILSLGFWEVKNLKCVNLQLGWITVSGATCPRIMAYKVALEQLGKFPYTLYLVVSKHRKRLFYRKRSDLFTPNTLCTKIRLINSIGLCRGA